MIRRKLKSEDGASLMLALLFFVICAMVGSVVLAAATAAAGRLAGLKQADQAKYTLESAADLLKANLDGWTYERSVPAGSTAPSSGTLEKGSVASSCIDTTIIGLADALNNARRGVAAYGTYLTEADKSSLAGGKTTVYITATGDDASALDPVKAEIVMDVDYNLDITLSIAADKIENASRKKAAKESPVLYLSLSADAEETRTTMASGFLDTAEVTWGHPVLVMNQSGGGRA